jgi:DNA-binding transcriptional LysR family regulator
VEAEGPATDDGHESWPVGGGSPIAVGQRVGKGDDVGDLGIIERGLFAKPAIEGIRAGRLVRVLADWCGPFAGFHLNYPGRRQPAPGFTVLVDALRYRKQS